MSQPLEALGLAGNARSQMAAIRTALASGDLRLADVMRDCPEAISHRPLFDIIRWARQYGPAELEALGRVAIQDRINLAMRLNGTSLRTRQWLISHDDMRRDRTLHNRQLKGARQSLVSSKPFQTAYARRVSHGELPVEIARRGGYRTPHDLLRRISRPSIHPRTARRLCEALCLDPADVGVPA